MYLFLDSADELAAELKRKFDKLNSYGSTSGMHRKWRSAYNAYYSNYFRDNVGLGTAGEQGEFATLHVNHLRNIIRHIHNNVTQNKLAFDSLAINSDVQSRNAALISNDALDYFFYEKRFEVQTKAALELSLVFGTAFLFTGWEPNQEIYGMDGEGQPVYKGGPRFTPFSPYDVIIDPTKDDYSRQNWVVTREIENKWDLMAVHAHLADDIERLPKISSLQYFLPHWEHDEDSVWVYRAYHKSTPALPKGRYTTFCENGLILDDADNPYGTLPVFCIRPEVKYGGAYGHATIFDLLPAQEAHNLLHSTIISNQRAFGTQNVVVFNQSNINQADVAGQLNIIGVDLLEGAPNGGLPQALSLCATPPEVFNYSNDIVSQMEMVSGVNSAARGAPPSNLTSGTAIALVATAANTFNSPVEAAYVRLCEESSSFLIKILQKFMGYEELIAVSGKNNTYAVTSFKGEDLQQIQRVRIHVGNPISKTLSGKVMVADNLLQNQQIKSTAQYLEVLETGSLKPILEHNTAQEVYIKEENDRLVKGNLVQMLAYDNHVMHIQEHLVMTFRPDVRDNQAVLSNVLQHIQDHRDQFDVMSMTNPQGLAIALGQPIQVAPPQGPVESSVPPPPGSAGSPAMAPSPAAEGGQNVETAVQSPEAVAASAERRAEKLVEKVS